MIGQSKELIVKEKPAPEEDEGETMTDEEKDKPAEGEEEKDKPAEGEEEKTKEEPKLEKAQQPEMLLLASAPKVSMTTVYIIITL